MALSLTNSPLCGYDHVILLSLPEQDVFAETQIFLITSSLTPRRGSRIWPAFVCSNSPLQTPAYDISNHQRTSPPSPGGEGWGEGERHTISPQSFCRHDYIILLSLPEQDVFAEEQVVRCHRARGAGFTDIVDVHTTAFDVLSRLAF